LVSGLDIRHAPDMVQRRFYDRGEGSTSFCEQKEAKKLHPLLPLARVPPQSHANGNKLVKFFCFFVFKQRRPSFPFNQP
jgi:hypothetical protein